jgi:hypothetical protein
MSKAALIVPARLVASERVSQRAAAQTRPVKRMPHPASTFQITATWLGGDS